MSLPPFVVLDTNVVLDWLLYQDKRVAPLIRALEDDAIRLASDEACHAELIDVLAREKIRATAQQRHSALRQYALRAHMIEPAPSDAALPLCRDADDQKFIELAVRCQARALVSRDKELLRMHHRMLLGYQLAVVEPADALSRF